MNINDIKRKDLNNLSDIDTSKLYIYKQLLHML